MTRTAAESPAPIVCERVRGATAGDRAVTCAGEMTTLASIPRRWDRNTRAMTDASTISPSDPCLRPSGTAIRFAGSMARAVLLEPLRHPLGNRDDLRTALTPRPRPEHVSRAELQQGRQPHRWLLPSSSRRRSAEIAALAAVAATTAVTPDFTALGRWMSDTPRGSLASRAALTAFSKRVLRRSGLRWILSLRRWSPALPCCASRGRG